MNNSTPGDVTLLLQECRNGNQEAFDALYHRYLPELHAQAASYLHRYRLNRQMQPTMIVHDMWMKLLKQHELSLENRLHFKAWAVEAMRCLIVSYWRHEHAQKNGGDKTFVPLDEAEASTPAIAPEWLALHEAIEQVTAIDEAQGRIAALHHLGGFSVAEMATVLQLPTEEVKRRRRKALAWVKLILTEGDINGH